MKNSDTQLQSWKSLSAQQAGIWYAFHKRRSNEKLSTPKTAG